MTPGPAWTLQKNDSTIDEFIDVRRKVGNQIIREYLLDNVVKTKFLILQISLDGASARFLAEAGVYENLRIVAIDSNNLAERNSEDLIGIFTEALENPEQYNTTLILSDDSTVR
jgi:hypothetical protein